MKTNFLQRFWRGRSNYEKALFFVFLLSLPFLHAQVDGDGVGYYAYLRSPLVDHNFSFSSDFQNPNEELLKIFLVDHFVDNPITKTGHLPNRSEEHTSELQSQSNLVCRLLLEKKKK